MSNTHNNAINMDSEKRPVMAGVRPHPMPENITSIDRETAEHYVWGSVCDGWHLLKHPELSVIQERVPPGAGEVKHYHSRARQFFYVLSGTATLEFDGKEVSFSAGQGVHVPPGVHHRFANHSSAEVIFIVVSCPPTAGDRTNVLPTV